MAWARSIGLSRALEMFPDEVIAAARQVEAERDALPSALGPALQPWPPMRLPAA